MHPLPRATKLGGRGESVVERPSVLNEHVGLNFESDRRQQQRHGDADQRPRYVFHHGRRG